MLLAKISQQLIFFGSLWVFLVAATVYVWLYGRTKNSWEVAGLSLLGVPLFFAYGALFVTFDGSILPMLNPIASGFLFGLVYARVRHPIRDSVWMLGLVVGFGVVHLMIALYH